VHPSCQTLERMNTIVRSVPESEATAASDLVRVSFTALAADDWEPKAQTTFLEEASPGQMQRKLRLAACALGAYAQGNLVGLLLMPRPAVLEMLFVHPEHVRKGLAKSLWERARTEIESSFPAVKTIELNSTPYALSFYRAVGFAPISSEFVVSGCRATRMACWLPARGLGAENAP
jgi:GNAT superfamily N-acetyltransferase